MSNEVLQAKINEFYLSLKQIYFDNYPAGNHVEVEELQKSTIKRNLQKILPNVEYLSKTHPSGAIDLIKNHISVFGGKINEAVSEFSKARPNENFALIERDGNGKIKVVNQKDYPENPLYDPLHSHKATFGYKKVIYDTETHFWEWYLAEHFEQNKAVKATNEKEEPPTTVSSNAKQDPVTGPAKKKELDFLDYFRGNNERMNLFFTTLTGMGAIDKDFNWIYDAPQNSIVACFDALEEINDENGICIVKCQKGIHGGKKKLYNLISQKFHKPIQYENFRKWEFNIDTKSTFKGKLKNAFLVKTE